MFHINFPILMYFQNWMIFEVLQKSREAQVSKQVAIDLKNICIHTEIITAHGNM